MKNNPFIDPPSSSTVTRAGMSANEWSTVCRRKGGRKNGYGRLGGGECAEEVVFPLQPRRDLSGDLRLQRY